MERGMDILQNTFGGILDHIRSVGGHFGVGPKQSLRGVQGFSRI